MDYELTHDVYPSGAIDDSIAAFAHVITAQATHRESCTIISIKSGDTAAVRELLNYILALSAQQLLAS